MAILPYQPTTNGSLALTSLLNSRPKSTTACWTSTTRHLKLKALQTNLSSLQNTLFLSLTNLRNWRHPQIIIQTRSLRVNTLLFHSLQPSVEKLIIKLGQTCPLLCNRIPLFWSHINSFLYCYNYAASLDAQCILRPGCIIATVSIRASSAAPISPCRSSENRGLGFALA